MLEVAETGSKLSKDEFEALVGDLRVELINAQFDLQYVGKSVVILIAGDDRIGCEEVVDRLHEWMDARYINTEVFSGDREGDDLLYPRFWRYWRVLPPNGRIGLVMHAWAVEAIGDLLLGHIKRKTFERRIGRVCAFERQLVDNGTVLLKFWLHMPKKGHKKRIKADKDSGRGWKIEETDHKIHERYAEVVEVAEAYLLETDTAHAPWQLVESADPNYRDMTVGRSVRDALVELVAREAAQEEPAPVEVTEATAPSEAPGNRGFLDGVDLSTVLERDDYRKQLAKFQGKLNGLVEQAHERGRSIVLAFEGWDAAGKGGVIRRLTSPIPARNYRVIPIAAPTDEEKARHYLWRFWRRLPRPGQAVIFDRTWYGRVLVERVEGFASVSEWRRAYTEINEFERELVEHGMLVHKFWMHIDADEQLRRFQARELTPYKKYKITTEDYRNRERWDDYVAAVEEMVARTNTEHAPWTLVGANDKRSARVQVLRTVCKRLERMLED